MAGTIASVLSSQTPTGSTHAGDIVQITGLVSPRKPDWGRSIPHALSLDQTPVIPDILIDFSLPEGTALAAAWCREHRVPLLSGVTGLSPAVQNLLSGAGEKTAVLWSPNFCVGINLLAQFCSRVAAVAGPNTRVQIEDIHHQWKKDAPSGTALLLGAAITAPGISGPLDIDYQSRREGEVIGDHQVCFELEGERITLSHTALDRRIFARGALLAAAWLARQPAGFYTTADWLKE